MGLLFWSIIIGIISMLIIIVSCYNEIIKNKNSVIRSWADIITYERQKNNILPQLGSIVKDYQKYEHDLQIKITELRGALDKIKPDELNNKILKEVEDQTQVLMKGVKVALENYPNLKTSSLKENFMQEISKQQQNIAASIIIFNKNIEIFNNELQTFPGSVINEFLNKEHLLEPFLESKALDSFEYKFKL